MEAIGKVVVFIGLLLLVGILTALPTMLLWNWLMPKIFGLIEIGFWEAFGLVILSSVFFKNSSKNEK